MSEKFQDVTSTLLASLDESFPEEKETVDDAKQAALDAVAQQQEDVDLDEITSGPAKPDQKRDDKGRFVAEGDTGEEEAQEVEELVYELDDETGKKQVFRGKSQEEIIQKLLKAQKEASKAIRDRERQIREGKAKGIVKPGPRVGENKKALTAEEQIELSSLLVTDPATAKKRLLEAELGVTPEEAQAAVETAHANAFMRETPEFYPCNENAQIMGDFLKQQGLAPVKENFAYAFQQLSKEGALLTAEGQREADVEEDQSEVEEVKPRISAKPTPAPRKTASSGISGRRTVRTSSRESAVPTDEEASRMPLDELRERILRLSRGANRAASR